MLVFQKILGTYKMDDPLRGDTDMTSNLVGGWGLGVGGGGSKAKIRCYWM